MAAAAAAAVVVGTETVVVGAEARRSQIYSASSLVRSLSSPSKGKFRLWSHSP